MESDNPERSAEESILDDASTPERVSGASAFKPASSKEIEKNRRRKEKEIEEQKKISDAHQQQHIRKKLLAECQTLLNVNYEWLDLDDYPDNRSVALAKRNRDYWLFICSVELVIFLGGVLELVPAWVGGASFGLLFITFCFSIKNFRRFFTSEPTLSELLQERKRLEFRALNHIKLLEGQEGLAWKCRKLEKYNRNLERKIFKGVMDVSAQKRLFGVIKEKKHIRLYLQLMLEAEKAYKRLQADYLKIHFKNLEKGVDDLAVEKSSQVKVRTPSTPKEIAKNAAPADKKQA
jgi:hypothetical protein